MQNSMFAIRAVGAVVGAIGFVYAAFVDMRIGGMIIAIGTIILLLGSK